MNASLHARLGADRRKSPRFPMNGALALRAQGLDVAINANIRDISAGGCKLDSRVKLTLRQAVRLELPQAGNPPLLVTGSVVRASMTLADRVHHYGVRFNIETAALRDMLVGYIKVFGQKHLSDAGRRVTGSVDVKFPVTVNVSGVGHFVATAIALNTGGMRLASDRVLRQEWKLKLDVKLPGGMIGSPVMVLAATVKPGVKPVRGTFVQDVEFVDPELRAVGEIERVMIEARHHQSRSAAS